MKVTLRNEVVMLGDTCEFDVAGDTLDECTVYVRHLQIQYLKPIAKLSAASTVRFFPEAPGDYSLVLHCRTRSGEESVKEVPFKVKAHGEYSYHPQQIRLEGNLTLWVPSRWEAQLMSNHEVASLREITNRLSEGWVVYDLGANLGYYSVHFAQRVGAKGHVYSVEANPMCIYFLQANLALNHCQNCTILPVAISHTEEQLLFTMNYASSGLGITQASQFYSTKMGHEIFVQSMSLDALISSCHLRSPNLIKIDVEGAEFSVIRGMTQTLITQRPLVFAEIHGIQSARQTLPLLEQYGYAIEHGGRTFQSADAFLRGLGDTVFQVICHPREAAS